MKGVTAPVCMVALSLTLAPQVSGSHSIASFYTPEKAAYCNLIADITGENYFTPFLLCWTPNDGFTATLRASGKPTTAYDKRNKWYYPPRSIRRLRFGQSWWANADAFEGTGAGRGDVLFRCQSRSSGLTCENRAGHGFWFGRFRGYRIF